MAKTKLEQELRRDKSPLGLQALADFLSEAEKDDESLKARKNAALTQKAENVYAMVQSAFDGIEKRERVYSYFFGDREGERIVVSVTYSMATVTFEFDGVGSTRRYARRRRRQQWLADQQWTVSKESYDKQTMYSIRAFIRKMEAASLYSAPESKLGKWLDKALRLINDHKPQEL